MIPPTTDRETGVRAVHELKTWPEFWQAVYRGEKTFELRKDDRAYRVGDELRLREYEPTTGAFTGNALVRYVSYIVRDVPEFGLEPGYAILGLSLSRVPRRPYAR